MAGKQCPENYQSEPVHGGTGNTSVKPRARDSKAFCEGRAAYVNGALKTTNPHTGLDAESALAWDSGWENANALGDNVPQDQTCCAQ